jgi:hypothetical protein
MFSCGDRADATQRDAHEGSISHKGHALQLDLEILMHPLLQQLLRSCFRCRAPVRACGGMQFEY